MVKMTNGYDVIWVNEDDVYDAKKDGFWVVGQKNYGYYSKNYYRRWR